MPMVRLAVVAWRYSYLAENGSGFVGGVVIALYPGVDFRLPPMAVVET